MFNAGKWSKDPEDPPLLPVLALELIHMLVTLTQAQIQTVKLPVLVCNNPSTGLGGLI